MRRRIPQSHLLGSPPIFHPKSAWTRISFLDLLAPGDDPRPPAHLLEPAYDDSGTTLIAAWPTHGDLEAVWVTTWKPDAATITNLAVLQADWPPALCDLRVRSDPHGRTNVVPCRTRIPLLAACTVSDEATKILHALERGAKAIGREVRFAA